MPIISTTTMGRGGEGKGKKRKKSKRIYRTVKHKNNKCFSWVTAVRVLSLTGSHNLPHLPRMPFNTVLTSGPAVGSAQISSGSMPLCSCLQCPQLSELFCEFSFVGALIDLLYILKTQNLPSWSCGFNLQFVQLVRRFWVFFLSHTAPRC